MFTDSNLNLEIYKVIYLYMNVDKPNNTHTHHSKVLTPSTAC